MDEDMRAELRGRTVGFVFQSFQLLPSLTALENVMLPLELANDAAAEAKAKDMLVRVGLGERLHHYPKHLSGGEQQRGARARVRRAAEAAPRRRADRKPRRRLGRGGDPALVRDEPRVRHYARHGDARRKPRRTLQPHGAPRRRQDRGMTQRCACSRATGARASCACSRWRSTSRWPRSPASLFRRPRRPGPRARRAPASRRGSRAARGHPWPRSAAEAIDRAGLQRAEASTSSAWLPERRATSRASKRCRRTTRCAGGCASPAPGMPDAPAARGPAPGTVWLEERLVTALARRSARASARPRRVRGGGGADSRARAHHGLLQHRAAAHDEHRRRASTGLIQTGSRVWYYLYAAGTPEKSSRWKGP